MDIDFGTLRFDAGQMLSQLRQDLRDDWFPDPLGFEDLLTKEVVSGLFEKNLTKNNGKYKAFRRDEFNMPKGDFTVRCALETGLCDRLLYQGIFSYLLPFYDPLLPGAVFSHRVNRNRSSGRYVYSSGVRAWKNFTGSVQNAAKDGSVLLATDLANFFEHIDVRRLDKILLELLPAVAAPAETKNRIRAHIALLMECIESWTYQGHTGLPQNRDASSFLANVYLSEVDAEMLRHHPDTYFRYMDDIRVVCKDHYAARLALKRLIVKLRDLGLFVNSKKTKICDGGNSVDVRELAREAPPIVGRLDNMWRTGSPDVIWRILPELREYVIELLNNGNLDSKEFRFCIGRLEKLARCSDFAVPPTFYADITPRIVEKIPSHPAATDQLVSYLRVVPVDEQDLSPVVEWVCDLDRAVYSWQNYLLWTLLLQKEHRDKRALECALALLEAHDTANRSGATLYAGGVGDMSARSEVANRFHTLNSFCGQRAALVAVHQLPYYPLIDTKVAPHVRPDLVGTYRVLRRTLGRYYAPQKREPLSCLVGSEPAYE